MAPTENAHPASAVRNSVPRIDLSKTFSDKKKRTSSSRKPMRNLNTATPLGLFSPPASQTNVLSGSSNGPDSERDLDQRSEIWLSDRDREEDPARLLISPPPEEELQQASLSRRSSSHNPSKSHLNNTTASSSIELSQSKRKRSMASTLSYATSSGNKSDVALPPSGAEPQATPNPKPRKQSRKSNRTHVRTHSNQSDISMDSLPSPTRAPGITNEGHSPRADNVLSTPSRMKRHAKVLRSPHVNNPNADYIPPYRPPSSEEPTDIDEWPHTTRKPVRLSRRSTTPAVIPPYEPPSVVFTPPREVVLSSPVTSPSKSPSKSRRKARKSKGLQLDIHVKHEPPDIDLSAPMPPASPTDDPLLLSGPPEEDVSPSKRRVMRDAAVFTLPQIPPRLTKSTPARVEILTRTHESLPPSSPPTQDKSSSPAQATYHWQNNSTIQDDDERSTDSMELDMQSHEYADVEGGIPNLGFGFPGVSADGWDDSDDDDPPHTPIRESGIIDEGIGEYTGHWQMTSVRTKADPPSSATRIRIEEWGNPKSPYPLERPSSRAASRAANASPSPSHRPSLSSVAPEAEEDDVTVHIPREQEEHTAIIAVATEPDEAAGDADEAEVLTMSAEAQMVEVGVLNNVESPAVSRELETSLDDEIEDEEEQEEEQEEQEVRAISLPLADDEDMEGEEAEMAEEEEVRRLSLEPGNHNPEDALEEQVRSHDLDTDANGLLSRGPGSFNTLSIPRTPLDIQSRSAQYQDKSSPAPRRDLSFFGDNRRRNSRISASFERAKQLFGAHSSPAKPATPSLPDVDENEDQETELANDNVLSADANEESEMRDEAEEAAGDSRDGIADMDSGDESDPTLEDPGLVQITSSDPKAAARAAAILKQHDYDCFTKIVLKQQQQRRRESLVHTTVEDLKKDNRRKTLAGAGVSKARARATPRRSLGTVVGDRVYLPGSPVMTLGRLLEVAEKEVQLKQSKGLTPHAHRSIVGGNALVDMALAERAPYQTPLPAKYGIESRPRSALAHEIEGEGDGEQVLPRREWTKEEWKILDGCFTDERIALAAETRSKDLLSVFADGDEEIPLVGVDLVDVDNVVERFIIEMGGEANIETNGWSKEGLRARARAIQNKQRAGQIAPPTTPYTPDTVSKSREPRPTSMEVPNMTPLGRRPFPPARKPVSLPPSVGQDAPFSPFSNLPEDLEEPPRRRILPATLLAPRYSHLLDEAVAISLELPSSEPMSTVVEQSDDNDDTLIQASASTSIDEASLEDASISSPEAPVPRKTGLGRLFSYIPGFSKTQPTRKVSRESKPGLPLPPPEVLEKTRGPVITPVRPSVPKSKLPKVNLNHQPIREKKSMIPRRQPKRMVELNKVGFPEEREHEHVAEPMIRPRRSSGSSVKDLVKTFEDRRESLESSSRSLMKTKSIGDLKKGGQKDNSKPVWKP